MDCKQSPSDDAAQPDPNPLPGDLNSPDFGLQDTEPEGDTLRENAACSASSVIPKRPRSPRSDCTPCSIAARRLRASSPSTEADFIPSGGSASSATPSPAARSLIACPAMPQS